ncbi:MAG: aldehyde dehydrogenase family protein [Phycisphaerales bacterium]|nr:aldehyde dehydrogenase family protein [Phycisphaerales bacterium]
MSQILLAGEWVDSPLGAPTFQSFNPSTGQPIERDFPITPWEQLEKMAMAGLAAAEALEGVDPAMIGDFLDRYADDLEANKDEICGAAHEETGLPLDTRLKAIEFNRMTNQLRQAATAARDVSETSWRQPLIDEEANIRSAMGPLGGPVFVIGPNNFPLAFNAISGGDVAAAIAAGNPVIAKGHPSHPETSRLLAECARSAISHVGLHPATVQFFHHCRPEDGRALLEHRAVSALAFTGSRASGLSLKAVADAMGKPAYLEMSSVNPIFFLPGAVADRGEDIAGEWAGSITLGGGQFCTSPGLGFAMGEDAQRLADGVCARFADSPEHVLFAESLVTEMGQGIAHMQEAGAQLVCGGQASGQEGFRWPATLLRVDGDTFESNFEALSAERFGPTALLVELRDLEQGVRIATRLEGQLTATIYAGDGDDTAFDALAGPLRVRCGRFLQDKMPTGVAVVASMVHGGPYPATGHSGFTAVGLPTSVVRFAMRRCWDGVSLDRLPAWLRGSMTTAS